MTSCKICGAEIIETSETCSACGAPVDPLPLEVPKPPQRLGAKIMHPKRARPRRQRQYSAVARPLALAAAVIGLFSLLMPWVLSSSPPNGTFNTIGHYATDYNDYNGTLAIVAVLVLLGSLLTFVSSVGSFASLAGVLMFALDMKNRFEYVSVGFPIAVVASVLGIASLLFRKPFRIWDRFLVFAPSRERRGLRFDVISIGAAVVALIATVLPWLVTKESWGNFVHVQDFSLSSFLDPNYLGSLNLSAASAVFIFGAIACLFTEVGATALVVGTAWSFLELRPMLVSASGNGFSFFDVSTGLGPGFYVGILAAVLGLLSLMFVFRMTLPDWLTVWSSGRSESPEKAPGPSAEAIERPTRSSLALLVSNWKKLAAIAIAIGAIVAAIGFSFLLPLSKIEVRVGNMNQESIAQVTIYLDGREIKSGFASSSAFLAAVVSTTAGVHTVSIDYGWPSQNQSANDGVPDWYSDLIAKPFQRNFLSVEIGFEGSMQPILQVTNESIPSGQKISVESITQHVVGSTVIASLQWGDVSIILTDGNSSVNWKPNTVDLTSMSGNIARHDFPETDLGALTVLCNVTDIMSNGYVNAGDFLTVITVGGIVFSSQTTYNLYIMYEPYSSLLAEIDFQGA